eukprot:821627-Prymnesium_polylepis.2
MKAAASFPRPVPPRACPTLHTGWSIRPESFDSAGDRVRGSTLSRPMLASAAQAHRAANRATSRP